MAESRRQHEAKGQGLRAEGQRPKGHHGPCLPSPVSRLTPLSSLPEGSRFLLPAPPITGVVERVGPGGVSVRLDGAAGIVEFGSRRFVAHRTRRTTWARETLVLVEA